MIQWKKYWKYAVTFISNEESDYSEENTSDYEDFRYSIFQQFQFKPEQKKICGNENHEKETKHIYASAADLLHVRIESQLMQMLTMQKRSKGNGLSFF